MAVALLVGCVAAGMNASVGAASPERVSCVSAPLGATHWYPGDIDGRDLIGNASGTLESGVAAGVAGKAGGAFRFDGVDGGVNLGNVPECDFGTDSSFTVEGWINSFGPTAQEVQFLFTLNYHQSLTVQWMAIGNTGPAAGKVSFAIRDANGTVSGVASPTALPSNTFHHVAGVREVTETSRTLRLYVDGALVDQAPDMTTAALALDADDYIGRRWPWTDNSTFNGLIDELTIYSRALSDCEIAALFKAGSAGKCKTGPGLVADLGVTQVDSPDPVVAGDELTYGITVTNAGPDPASSVTLTDWLPADAAFVSSSAGCGETGGIVSCDLGTLRAGVESRVMIVIRPATPGPLTNQVAVAASEADLDCANDAALATTTVIPPAATTTTTTATTTTVTPTTTLPTGCAAVPVGLTFASLDCRLGDLIAAVQAQSPLGALQPKLEKTTLTARQREKAAEAACAAGKTKPAGKQLKKVVRSLIQFSHRLRSNTVRKKVPEAVREPLAVAADTIRVDARLLKTQLACPQ